MYKLHDHFLLEEVVCVYDTNSSRPSLLKHLIISFINHWMFINMTALIIFIMFVGGPLLSFACDNVTIVTRAEWGARKPREIQYMETPVSVVFIHHTDTPECTTQDTCAKRVRSIQDFHMDDRGWTDIAYNYLIGQDGRAYEGRKWDRVGAHTKGWNNVSIAFSFIGNYTSHLPDKAAISAALNMIECGIRLGKITKDYSLYGHRDVGTTKCPGDKLYGLIKTWEHYGKLPPVKPTPKPYTGSTVKPSTVSVLNNN